jgi:hypothetical protein
MPLALLIVEELEQLRHGGAGPRPPHLTASGIEGRDGPWPAIVHPTVA